MALPKIRAASARAALVLVVGGLSLSACATRGYVDEQIALVGGRVDATNSRLDQVDARVQDAIQRADTAGRTAQQAATDAQAANQRIDALTGRVDQIQQMRGGRTPRN
jgi:hypothetical protein